jgi:hypothetical protein
MQLELFLLMIFPALSGLAIITVCRAWLRWGVVRWSEAQVDDRKILDYLLATEHPVGGGKAAFFAAVGYRRDDWTRLRDDLLGLPVRGEVVSKSETRFGQKFVVDGVVQSPNGRMIGLRTVWITDGPGEPPRFVTAYPS